jgi:hypothetical protein
MASRKLSAEKLGELIEQLNIAKATVYVTAAALDQGDSDLEILSAKALQPVVDVINEVADTLNQARLCMPEDAAAATA